MPRRILSGAGLGALLIAAIVALVLVYPAYARADRSVDVPRSASLVLVGEHRGDAAGASVARAGDVNGDARSDMVVGAPLADPHGRSDAGAAYVVFGGGPRGRVRLGALGDRGFRIEGAVPLPRNTFHPGGSPLTSGVGAVVAGAGDVNGDDLADVLVSGGGTLFVVFGKRDTAPVDLAALGQRGYAIRSDGDFTVVVAGRAAGDTNGDGLADTAVTVDIDGDEDGGGLFVVFGKADTAPVELSIFDPQSWGLRVRGGLGGLYLGTSAAPAGDRNGDGLGDLLIGAPGTPDRRGRYGRGAVFVVYGKRNAADLAIRPPEPFGGYAIGAPPGPGGFGSAVARLGRGFVAGAPGSTQGLQRGRGAAWIVPSRHARPIRLAGPRTGGPAGVAVDAPRDVAGDPGRDVLVMTRGRRDRAANALLFSARGRRIATYRGLRNGHEARSTAAGVGDVGGSQRNDLIFGSPGANAAYVLTVTGPR